MEKRKINKAAIIAFVLPIISILGSVCFIFFIRNPHLISFLEVFFAILYFLCAMPLLSIFSFGFGVITFINLIRQGLLKDFVFAGIGILFSVLAFFTAGHALGTHRPESAILICQVVMKDRFKDLTEYSAKHHNQYPDPNKWCDELLPEPNDKYNFFHPGSNNFNKEPPYKSLYAINPNAEPNSPKDVVLLFETKSGWNQAGGAELMSFDNHFRKGCNVLFNDGTVKFISPKNKDKLNWGIMRQKNE